MSIRAGQMLFSSTEGFIIDRLQRAGASNVNIPLNRVWELGDYQSVGVVRDIPDLTFTLETLDISTEIESMLTSYSLADIDTNAPAAGTVFDYFNALPLDVASAFRSTFNQYNIVKSVAIPQLWLESVEYRFGVRADSTERFTFRGDSIYYVPGSTYIFQVTATAGQQTFTAPSGGSTPSVTGAPIAYVEHGVTRYALNVSVNGVRKFLGADYTESTGGATPSVVTVTFAAPLNAGDIVKIVYGSTVPTTLYPTTPGSPASLSVKPASVRGKDIDVYVQVPGATPSMVRWNGVQTAAITRRVTLQNDEEFGNYHFVAQDYDEVTVVGDIALKPQDTTDLFNKIAQITNVPTYQVAGAFASQPLQLEVRISNPDTGALIKTLYVPDARFNPPAIEGQAKNKLTPTFHFESDSSKLYVIQGARSASFTG